MTIDIEPIKTKLLDKHQLNFNHFQDANFEEVVDLFLQVLQNRNLTLVIQGLHHFYVERHIDTFMDARENIATHFEKYFKILVEMSNEVHNISALASCFKHFFSKHATHLAKVEKDNFFNTDKNNQWKKSPHYFQNILHFGEELKTIYELRNALAHSNATIKYQDGAEPKRIDDECHFCFDIKASVNAYLFVTYKYAPQLKSFFEKQAEPDMTPYLKSVQSEFDEGQSHFIHIKGKFEDIIHAKTIKDIEVLSLDIDEDTVENLRRAVKGKGIRKMVVVGNAGMGKTTTTQYLASSDAEILLNRYDKLSMGNPLPIYIELKNFKDEERQETTVSLHDLILEKVNKSLQIPVEETQKINQLRIYLEKLLREGKITLFLDGMNEIPKDFKESKRNAIDKFMEDYEKVFYLLTSRKEDYSSGFFSQIPTFELQKMNLKQIELFLDKNANDEAVRHHIFKAVQESAILAQFVGVPFVLLVLIQVVAENGEIPNSYSKIIGAFINNLYHWQQRQDKAFDDTTLDNTHFLLCHLATQVKQKYDANPDISFKQVLDIFKQRKEDYELAIDLHYVLKIAVDLNILVKKDKKYTFVHQLFAEYYVQEELEL